MLEDPGKQSTPQQADILNLRPEDLDEPLTRAAERGAERALACIGLENGHAAAATSRESARPCPSTAQQIASRLRGLAARCRGARR